MRADWENGEDVGGNRCVSLVHGVSTTHPSSNPTNPSSIARSRIDSNRITSDFYPGNSVTSSYSPRCYVSHFSSYVNEFWHSRSKVMRNEESKPSKLEDFWIHPKSKHPTLRVPIAWKVRHQLNSITYNWLENFLTWNNCVRAFQRPRIETHSGILWFNLRKLV